MNQVHAFAETLVHRPVDEVRPAVERRAARFPERAVLSRPRPDTLVAADPGSSLVVTWVLDGPAGFTSVRLSAAYDGRNGLLGLYDRLAAPARLRLLLEEKLRELAEECA